MSHFRSALALSVCACLPAAHVARAAIFAFTDHQGIVHYSNVPVDTRFELLIATPPAAPAIRPRLSELLEKSKAFSGLIDRAARANRLEPALVRAVIVTESGCDPNAVSIRGARGLMQLMPATARHYGVRNVFDPEQNVSAGAQYLRDLNDRYRNDLELVLAAYNAGPAAVDRHGGNVPPIKETLAYVPQVIQLYRHLMDLAQAH
jgi:soluble lytic murein transglycosylase-like protein